MTGEETRVPVTYESHAHVEGPYFHGTKAVLAPGDELVTGYGSNFEEGRVLRHLYFTTLVPTAAWGAQLAAALAGREDPGHVYVVEPAGPFEDDPNVTDKKFPGNPTRSFRTSEPLRVVREVDDWPRLSAEDLAAWRERLAVLLSDGGGEIVN